MEEIIIYVAGNPDLYPIEYYDSETGSFQGMVPGLLREFAAKTNYDVRYYQTAEKDRRENLATNRQVDIISGCFGKENFAHKTGEEIVVLETLESGEPIAYQLLLTETAPEGLGEDLRRFLAELSQEEKDGMVLAASRQEMTVDTAFPWPLLLLFFIILLALGAALVHFFRRSRKQVEALQEEREKDALTGVGNMDYLSRQFPILVGEQNRILYSAYYFYVDAEHLNRMTSRAETNEFLRYMAKVLTEYETDIDLLARVSDGGFAVLRLSPGEQEARTWFMPALKHLQSYAEDNQKPYVSHVSVGIYRLQQNDNDLHEILFNAGQSARAAYEAGEDYRICTEEFMNEIAVNRKLQADVGRGLKYGEFHLYIQFYVSARTGEIAGGEALSRWEHPELGFLKPGRFVPLLENEGLIGQLDYYSFDKVCAFLAALNSAGVNDFFISCNFSRDTFSMKDFVPKCMEILNKYEFDRRLLVFELTESAMTKNMEVVKNNIEAIKEMGIRLALDDFGQGFTSLFDFQDYPIDVLKLDKGLIDIIETDTGSVISGAMIKVGHSLGIKVLAEGVENDEQVRILQDMDCDTIQGYRFYQPLPAWEVEKKLVARHKGELGIE